MLKPIDYESERLCVHSFRPYDLQRFDQFALDILSILSDDFTLKFIPGKRLNTIVEAEAFLQTMIVNFHNGRNFMHFITDKKMNRVIGIIDLISPKVAREHYEIEKYPYFIEFYLSGLAAGTSIMSEILPAIVSNVISQGITCIGAVIDRNNTAAKKVLEKASFLYKSRFDILQDFYETDLGNYK
ncbi:GNAT family N-acetyltransferase [Pedobacter sp. WC2423]|uniref:GNAT family N-acetyltransferase n=1 Tax=Pedobacter sp. WC2423 TaxID=3234142 RepID=UPI0034674F16